LADHLDKPTSAHKAAPQPDTRAAEADPASAPGTPQPTGRRWLRRLLLPVAALLALMLAVPPVLDALVTESTARAVANGIEDVEPKPVALLLGTA
jgi:SanA protein